MSADALRQAGDVMAMRNLTESLWWIRADECVETGVPLPMETLTHQV
ncbi:MAG TPA: hypothetical protein PLI90_02270 [Rhodocyclaceae bacterium]|nr:hypothetical protein [Rhodocyclaceae bacterium]